MKNDAIGSIPLRNAIFKAFLRLAAEKGTADNCAKCVNFDMWCKRSIETGIPLEPWLTRRLSRRPRGLSDGIQDAAGSLVILWLSYQSIMGTPTSCHAWNKGKQDSAFAASVLKSCRDPGPRFSQNHTKDSCVRRSWRDSRFWVSYDVSLAFVDPTQVWILLISDRCFVPVMDFIRLPQCLITEWPVIDWKVQ
jgi:hypothetical protein